jgi:hypothetical protein
MNEAGTIIDAAPTEIIAIGSVAKPLSVANSKPTNPDRVITRIDAV